MQTAMIIILICLILFALLAMSSVRFHVSFFVGDMKANSDYTIWLMYGLIRIKKQKESRKSLKPKKKKKPKTLKDEQKSSKSNIMQSAGDYISLFIDLIKLLAQFVKKSVGIEKFHFSCIYSSADPFIDGITFAGSAGAGALLTTLVGDNFNTKDLFVDIRPDFSGTAKCLVTAKINGAMKVWSVFWLTWKILMDKHARAIIKNIIMPEEKNKEE